jgi:hypothetical protein
MKEETYLYLVHGDAYTQYKMTVPRYLIIWELDPAGNHTPGSIKVKFSDGVETGGMFMGHDFVKEA